MGAARAIAIGSEFHVAAMVVVVMARQRWRRRRRQLGNHGLSSDEQAGDRDRVLQRGAHHFGWIDDTLGDQVAVLASLGIIAPVVLLLLQNLADHHRAVGTGVSCYLARWPADCLPDDVN